MESDTRAAALRLVSVTNGSAPCGSFGFFAAASPLAWLGLVKTTGGKAQVPTVLQTV